MRSLSPHSSAAALGQTKAELRAYLSRYHVCYTFARDDFVPDPEAPLMRVSHDSMMYLYTQTAAAVATATAQRDGSLHGAWYLSVRACEITR